MAVKNPTRWRSPNGEGYVVSSGTQFIVTNLGSFLNDNLGNFLVTNDTYVIPKNPTIWSASGV